MTCRRKWLDSFSPHCPTTSVILSNNAALDVQGSGTICATINTGGASTSIVLCNVLFVPDLTKNLVLMSRLIDLGCMIQLNCAGATIWHPQQAFPPLVAKCINNMLVLNLQPTMSQLATQALATRTQQSITLNHLHLCLGHIGMDWLKLAVLAVANITINTGSELSSCTTCIHAKQHKKPISQGPTP
jgi:hypothetical protein